jgi:SAM-dependent methyltransferase
VEVYIVKVVKEDEIKKAVKEGYGKIASQGLTCCGTVDSCCGARNPSEIGKTLGYSADDLQSVPEGSNLGLGCGNPIAIASLAEGETVVDLGSGAGFDCFLAAGRVGKTGRVIGVDMTPEMIERARENARRDGIENVEFRLGEIERLPVDTNTADCVISNCVINLSPDKDRVFGEAFRVLRPGGRLMVSDIVLLRALPAAIRDSIEAYIGCLAGASLKGEYMKAIEKAGFDNIRIIDETLFPVEFAVNDPIVQSIMEKSNLGLEDVRDLARTVVSIRVQALKPEAA